MPSKQPTETGSADALAANIRRVRKERDLTQYQLGLLIGAPSLYVSRWERGMVPDASWLPKLSEALGCSIDDLYRKAAA
jgi:transcriptional regulator with XRE-family HTH domain